MGFRALKGAGKMQECRGIDGEVRKSELSRVRERGGGLKLKAI